MADNRALQKLATNAPRLESAVFASLAETHFGLTGTLRPLYSEGDQNMRLTCSDGSDWVLKLVNTGADPGVVDLQIAALLHLESVAPDLPVPRVRQTRDGGHVAQVTGPDGSKHLFLVLSFVRGEIAEGLTENPAGLRAAGTMVARLGRALRGFHHPAAGRSDLLWDLRVAPLLKAHLDEVPEAVRTTVAPIFDHFIAEVMPKLAGLRAQVIHGDVHEHNLILGPGGKIAGVIDFGDIIHAPLIFDLCCAAGEMVATPQSIAPVLREFVAGYHSITPLEEAEADLVYDLMLMRLVLSLTINEWRTAQTPEAENYMIAAGFGSLDALSALTGMGRAAVTAIVRESCGMPVVRASDLTEMVARRRRLMGSDLYLFYDPPLHMVRGQDVWLFDSAGRPFLDCYNNVPIVGHCHPHVVGAISRQAAVLNTNTRYLGEEILRYGERLTESLPGDLQICAFVNSGSEANDIAWRMARAWTGNRGGLVQEFGYHGITEAIDAFSPSAHRRGEVAGHMRTLAAPDGYRGTIRDGEADLGPRYAMDADRAISELQSAGLGVAAYICDSAFMTNGVLEPQAGYVAGVFDRVRAAGGLCIADEVQAGFGRMGKYFWGFRHHGVVPDIITAGKPAGNGHPIGIVITRPEIYERFIRDVSFFSTFGGNNVSCAAGNAVLDVIARERLVANATEVGAYFKAGLARLADRHALIGCVRGTGLALGLELVRDRQSKEPARAETARLLNLMRDEGVLTGAEGAHGNIVKIRPPLTFTREHADIAVAAFDAALGRI